MKKILMLTDYKGNFTSKYDAVPYRSGMNKDLLKKYFEKNGYKIVIKKFSDINFREENVEGQSIIYPSSEDNHRFYKSYIEDIILGLEVKGAHLIPKHNYLRAHDNKVFMEILRDMSGLEELKTIKTNHFGTYEEFIQKQTYFTEDKYVIKASEGAMSVGVELSKNKLDLRKKIKSISNSKDFKLDLKDKLRSFKHQGYIQESSNRKKYIIQNFIPNLINDWKIIIFGDKFYMFYRATRDNDFRASGSKKFTFNDDLPIPDGIFNLAKKVFDSFDTPHLSLDIVFDGYNFHVIEFQFLYFGTIGHTKSESFFKKINNKWERIYENLDLEEVYVDSIVKFIEKENSK
jgi:glutathione synthase/RimK-type ligase-like ATP-grasp enzyme